MKVKKFKYKKIITKSEYKRKAIICVCGKELPVDYDNGKLTNKTWCVDCHRYYEKKDDSYIITKYRCFECQTQHTKLFDGFNRYGELTKVCESCLNTQIIKRAEIEETAKKELKVLHSAKTYNPEGLK